MALLTAPFSLSNLSSPHQKTSFFWRYKWRIQRYTVAVNSSFYRHFTLFLTVFFKMRYRQCLPIPSSRIWNQKRNCTNFRTVMDCTLPSALRAGQLSWMHLLQDLFIQTIFISQKIGKLTSRKWGYWKGWSSDVFKIKQKDRVFLTELECGFG